ncbi:NmrA family NAD(P)-binding protein [Alphaproteobacteria bacterium]|nr:NmrA family NAD(P)-binding protein [Alphaproteobacteria bacterium]
MILVTCAGGKTGRAIAHALASAGQSVRAMVLGELSVPAIESLGVAQVCAGDLANADDVERATDGITAIYYIAPNMSPDERRMGTVMIEAAQAQGVSRFVFHSVLHTQIEALAHHWERHFVEQDIINSGLPFTILQVGSYMQNMLPGWSKMVETGIHRMAYDIDAPMSLVDLDDVAETAVKIITGDGHQNGMFEIAGPAITLREKAAILSDGLGIPIRAEKEPLEAFLAHGKELGFNNYTLATMAKMFPYYDNHGLVGSTKILGWLLGRPPTDFKTFVSRTIADKAQGPVLIQ